MLFGKFTTANSIKKQYQGIGKGLVQDPDFKGRKK